MNNDFLVTSIDRVIFVDKNEYPQKELSFRNDLESNELIFHFSGNGTVCFNGKTLKTQANTIRFLPKGENHEYTVKKETFGECIDVFFDTDYPISDEAFVINFENNSKIGHLFKKLFSIWVSKKQGYYFECISLLYKIFAEIQKNDYIPEKQYNMIKPAIKYIEENFLKEKISIPFLAEKCDISEAYLKRLFIRKIGLPPTKYIIQLKINYACDLLKSEIYSITQVSEMCGYSDIYYFSRQFKEYTGISPTTFLNKYKSSK